MKVDMLFEIINVKKMIKADIMKKMMIMEINLVKEMVKNKEIIEK